MKFIFLVSYMCIVTISTSTKLLDDDAEYYDESNENSRGVGMKAKGLTSMLLSNYDKELMPTKPVNVRLEILLLKVKATVERDGIFESVVALFIEWFDPRMTWEPALYDNVSVLALDPRRVWLPDIAMTNAANHIYDISRDMRFVVRISNNGIFRFVPTGTARTWCQLKLITFPFDVQTCSLEFESWSLNSSTMVFQEPANVIVDPNFMSSQWVLCNKHSVIYQVRYNFTYEYFSRVKFELTVRRKSSFYLINLVFPCATLSGIQLLAFAIPMADSSTDRIGFATTNLLTLVVFQTMVTAEMPKTSDAVTTVSRYVITLIIVSAVSILESVIVERMQRITAKPPPPLMLRFTKIIRLCGVNANKINYPAIYAAETALDTSDGSKEPSIRVNSADDANAPLTSVCQRCQKSVSEEPAETDSAPVGLRRCRVRRQVSNFTAVKEHQSRKKFIEQQHAEMWSEVATKLDVVVFTLCLFVAVGVPVFLFFPLISFDEKICQYS